MEKPPLYYMVAEETADLFAPWLPLHDGARLSNVLWLALIFGGLILAARQAWRGDAIAPGTAASLVLMGSFGFVFPAHLLVVDIALLAGCSMMLLGFCMVLQRPGLGGILLGTGAGIGFLAKGLLAPGWTVVTALVLAALFQDWRSRSYGRGMTFAALVAIPWLVTWPVALYLHAPDLFMQWLLHENLGRFFGYSHLGATPETWYYAKTIPWFTFPALPLALWALWRRRARFRHSAPMQICVVFGVVMVTSLAVAGSMRAQYLLPLLLPLSLLAAAELSRVPLPWRQGVATAADALFGLAAVVLWGIFLSVALLGVQSDWLGLRELLPLSAASKPSPFAIAIAVVATLSWLLTVRCVRATAVAIGAAWAAGMTLAWVLLATLWLPWLNEAKSYRMMFEDMRAHLPAHYNCVASIHLGESEAAMLDYEGGIVAIPLETHKGNDCQLVWQQTSQAFQKEVPDSSWQLLWSGHRLGDPKELHRLFLR